MTSTYRRKRDFKRTPEPRGRRPTVRKRGKPVFVIQEHHARRLHYDFRIEVNGTLRSWAIPKGPSTDPREKRLAIATEDHPLEYARFEGVIPAGEYGAGTVVVWDTGTFENLTREDGRLVPVDVALEHGHAHIELHGRKLEGGYALHRTGRGSKARWLLLKTRDEAADARRNPVSTQRESVLSGLSAAHIRRQAGQDDRRKTARSRRERR